MHYVILHASLSVMILYCKSIAAVFFKHYTTCRCLLSICYIFIILKKISNKITRSY